MAVAGYLIGRSRGLVWQLSGIATLVIGGLCATVLSLPLGRLFADGILGRFVAWVAVYALIAVCLYALSLKLKHRIDELEYAELDRRFGGMLGATKGLLAFAVVVLIAVSLSSGIEGVVKRSASGQSLRYLVHELRPLLPERVHAAFGPYLDRLEPDALPDPDPTPELPPRPYFTGTEPQVKDLPEAPVEPAPPPTQPAPPADPMVGPPRPTLERPRAPTEAAPRPERRPAPRPAPVDVGPLEFPDIPFPRPDEPPPRSGARDDDPFDTTRDPRDPLAPR